MMRAPRRFLGFRFRAGRAAGFVGVAEAWLAALLQLYLPAARVEADSQDVVIRPTLQLGEDLSFPN